MDTTLRLPGPLEAAVRDELRRAIEGRWASRTWQHDPSVWTQDEGVAASIADRLGWLGAPMAFRDELAELTAFADELIREGFRDALVCGMGGSSLAPEVFVTVLPGRVGHLRVTVLDSTDPDAVRAVDETIDPAGLLRIIATKSGTTTETLAFHAHLWQAEQRRVGRFPASRAGESFVSITDPGKPMEAVPHANVFRETFANPRDVGGRYSALTYVGLVPAALAGLDLGALIDDAMRMAGRCQDDAEDNPGLVLGTALGALAKAGRDKLTFVLEPALAPLGAWLEQLIAESTGKQGVGIVPVDGEPLGAPDVYRADRVFVRVGRTTDAAWRTASDAALAALEAAGHPVIDITLDGGWVAGECFRWEFATAVAGASLGVNPFDEPNVTESKQNTAAVLDRFHHDHRLPDAGPEVAAGRLRVTGSGGSPADVLRALLADIPDGGYVQVGAYICPTGARTQALRAIQALIRDRTRAASTMGYGPRFLHSTGQLHKGGPATGRFVQLVAGHSRDLEIPGRKETFGTLIDAQALGDLRSLQAHGLPVVRVHLGDDPDAALPELAAALATALA